MSQNKLKQKPEFKLVYNIKIGYVQVKYICNRQVSGRDKMKLIKCVWGNCNIEANSTWKTKLKILKKKMTEAVRKCKVEISMTGSWTVIYK